MKLLDEVEVKTSSNRTKWLICFPNLCILRLSCWDRSRPHRRKHTIDKYSSICWRFASFQLRLLTGSNLYIGYKSYTKKNHFHVTFLWPDFHLRSWSGWWGSWLQFEIVSICVKFDTSGHFHPLTNETSRQHGERLTVSIRRSERVFQASQLCFSDPDQVVFMPEP